MTHKRIQKHSEKFLAEIERMVALKKQIPRYADVAKAFGVSVQVVRHMIIARMPAVRTKVHVEAIVKPRIQSGMPRKYIQYSSLNPLQKEKAKARSRAKMALKRGHITRSSCVQCGAVVAEMHHESYDKPLEIVWLCRPCHMALHRSKQGLMSRDDLDQMAARLMRSTA